MLAISIFLNIFLNIHQPSDKIIDGYTDRMSAFPGDSIGLYLNADTRSMYTTRLFDLSGKVVASYSIKVFPQTIANADPFENGFGYKLTQMVAVPHLKSGVYLWENKIPFIIKSHKPKITILYSSNTTNAYCNAGGKSLYGFNSPGSKGSSKVSFLRPLPLPQHSEAFLQWVIHQDYADTGYIADLDLEDYTSIKHSKLLIIPGHSEYWTLQARRNFDRFVNEGKNALVLSGNTMWWQVRYNKTADQLICYRSTKEDPIRNAKLKTILWNDPSLNYPIIGSIGADFSMGGYGLRSGKGWNGFKIVIHSPLLESTSLKPGDILLCPSDEWDGAPLGSFENGMPQLNYEALGFERVELIGFDQTSGGAGTWIIFKSTRSSGVVINTASTDWCSSRGIGTNKDIQKITDTMIRKLLNNEVVFSNDVKISSIAN